MGLRYPSTQTTTPSLTQYVGIAQPIEDRAVVYTEEDLRNPNTWGEVLYGFMWGLRIYEGMLVTVTSDTTPSKNGLYWLKNMPGQEDLTKIGTWGTAECMSIDGWEKVGGGQVEVDDETIKFDPNRTPGDADDNQIWVNMVDGGANWGSRTGN